MMLHYNETISNFSGNFSQLCEFIGKSAEALAKNANHLDNVLATLDIQQHSLGILGVLWVILIKIYIVLLIMGTNSQVI